MVRLSVVSMCFVMLISLAQESQAQLLKRLRLNAISCGGESAANTCSMQNGMCSSSQACTTAARVETYSLQVVPTISTIPMTVQSATVPQALGVGSYFKDRVQFKRGLLQAAYRAESKGDVPAGTTFALGRHLRLHPGRLTELMEDASDNADAQGINIMSPDWNAFLDFLEKLIPLIVKLIDLFSMNIDQAIDTAIAMSPEQIAFWMAA